MRVRAYVLYWLFNQGSTFHDFLRVFSIAVSDASVMSVSMLDRVIIRIMLLT